VEGWGKKVIKSEIIGCKKRLACANIPVLNQTSEGIGRKDWNRAIRLAAPADLSTSYVLREDRSVLSFIGRARPSFARGVDNADEDANLPTDPKVWTDVGEEWSESMG
jgi:hypothetical protein